MLLLLLLMSTSVDAGWIPSSLSLSSSSSSSLSLLSSSSSSSLSSVTTATSQKKNNKNNNTPRQRKRTEESSSSLSSSKPARTRRTIRIRKMIESDIQDISMFLVDGISTTSSNKKESSIGWQSFKDRIDRLWLQNDISTLLLRRLHAISAGDKLSMRFQQLMNDDPFFEKEVVEYWTNEQKIDWLWTKGGYDSQRLRELIYRASKDTGELNVWQTPYYNFDISPKDPSWLYHLQITATSSSSSSRRRRTMRINDSSNNNNNNNNDDDDEEIVVGFCELAMLSNPLLGGLEQQEQHQHQQQQDDDDDDFRQQRNHDSSTSLSSSSDSLLLLSSSSSSFSPAIVNLAVSSQYRRQGIATYLIECSKKYVRQYWKKNNNTDCCLGLYVEQTNYGAIRLYEQTGFRIRTTIAPPPGDGNNRLGDMWYMTCSLS